RCTFVCFSFTGPASTEISTLSLHDALPISRFATGALARRAHTNLHVHSRRRSRRARPLDVDASTGCAAMTPTSRTLAAVASLALLACGTQSDRSITANLVVNPTAHFSTWSEPVNLGSTINTTFNEQGP